MAVRSFVLGVGIFVVYLLMLAYGIEAFYPSPQYDEFCTGDVSGGRYSGKLYPTYPDSASNCTFSKVIQQEVDQCVAQRGLPVYEYSDTGCIADLKECNFCDKEFQEAREAHEKVLFVIALIFGIVTLLGGYWMLSTEPVGTALMASGIGAIFYGSARNWENLSNIWRFLLLLVALVLLIWIAIRANLAERKHRWMFWRR